MTLQTALQRLTKGGPEQQAIKAGEIDAIIDYSSSNVLLFPAARRALHEVADRTAAINRGSIANSLLAALPSAEYQYLLAGLEPVTLKRDEVLHKPGMPIRHVYFPAGCVVCLMTTIENHKTAGVGLVGYEGMVGISLVSGAGPSSVRAVVGTSGSALRMEAARFYKAFAQCPSLQRLLHRYTHAMLVLARQTIACNCFHLSEARVAHWLLTTSDRARSEKFFLTQAFLADLLGLRRATVTEIACRLRRRNLISYERGRITILNRQDLEAASCGCYARITAQEINPRHYLDRDTR
jgi:CRP-like cAMP-binding protein